MTLVIAVIVAGNLAGYFVNGPQELAECQRVAAGMAQTMEEVLGEDVQTVCLYRTEGGGVAL